jgi:hypothetical protein
MRFSDGNRTEIERKKKSAIVKAEDHEKKNKRSKVMLRLPDLIEDKQPVDGTFQVRTIKSRQFPVKVILPSLSYPPSNPSFLSL